MTANIDFLFKITGAKFYMDWLLITNPISKNPIIKFLWGWMKSVYTANNYKYRFRLSIILFSVHFVMFIFAFFDNNYNFMWEIIYNIYPMIIQIYVGYRCWCVIKWKKYKNMLITGSRALNYHFPNYKKEIDWDFIGTKKEVLHWFGEKNITPDIKIFSNLKVYTTVIDSVIYEFEIAEEGYSGYEYLEASKNEEFSLEYANLNVLFSMKKSHIHQPINFNKHIEDYHFLKNCLVIDHLEYITKKRIKETDTRLKSKTPKLNQTVDEFVKESQSVLNRIYDHDDLHKIVAYYNEPLYFKIQPSHDVVMCSKKLWDKLNYEDKIKCIHEEAFVIALERKIIPMLFQKGDLYTKEKAVKWALMRICTTLASGWFREFAIENYFQIVNRINYIFIDNFFEKYENNTIKLYTE